MNKLLTKKEMADLLRISLNTLNYWICRKKIPFIKLGTGKNALVRFSLDEIERWLRDMRAENEKTIR